jgi:acyl transferase domain-containing protein
MTHEEESEQTPAGAVAIVGMVGRFPGANDLETYWRNIRDGIEAVTHFTDERLQAAGVSQAVLGHAAYVKARGVVDEIELFDPAFFGYSARDAVVMDPQQRLFLQCSWEALEAAGYDPRAYQGLIGVYGGSTASSYQSVLWANMEPLGVDGLTVAIGNELPFLTTRVSYKLDLKGPSCPVQTACSTSLVAVHLACQGLLNAECDMALAGGVSLRLPQDNGYYYQEEGILSPDGRCRPFDAKAGGTLFSNGVGVVVLKRLEDAIADGDTVYAVIRGSAINNDGARKASFTAPGVVGQSQVVADALASAQVDPESISYIEAHGTATALGDSIEIQALTKAFASSKRNFCALGSVKANIGHLDAAAGVAGLIKTVLALRQRQLPPMVHFQAPNPDIHFESTPFYVNQQLRDWPASPDGPRRAGVSSFGFGGTNAHVIVEEAPARPSPCPSRAWQVLPLSAQTPTSLEAGTANLVDFFGRHRDLNVADAAFTLSVGRRAFRQRRIAVCRTVDDAIKALDARDPRVVYTGSHDGPDRPVVFLFPGQGTQYVGMARELYEQEPLFRSVLDDCARGVSRHGGLDLLGALYPPAGDAAAAERLTRTSMAQPALFAVEYALARLLMEWGITPAACLGHSIGEWVAACIAGVIDLDDALRIVALRGRLMEQMPPGVMAAVPMSERAVLPMLGDRLWLAAVNHPTLSVVSGEASQIDALEAALAGDGVEIQRLHTSHAFHSALMDGAIDPIVAALQQVELRAPAIPFISNVSGTWITGEEAQDPAYWGRQIRQPVRFAAGVATLLQDDSRVFVEVGAGNTLTGLVRRQAGPRTSQPYFSMLRHAREQGSDVASVLSAVGRLWLSGANVDWAALFAGQERTRIALPAYAFDRQRYWVDPPAAAAPSARRVKRGSHERNPRVDDWFYVPGWQRQPTPLTAQHDRLPGQRSWLLLADESGLADRIAARLEANAYTVVVASIGERFERLGPRRYAIDPVSRADFDALLKELLDLGQSPSVILHLSGIGPSDADPRSMRHFSRDQRCGFDSLLALAQSLGEATLPGPVRVALLTNDAQDVIGSEPVAPGRAIGTGLALVMPQEYPHISTRIIDLSWEGAQSVQSITGAALDRVLSDAASERGEHVIAYRGGHRWVKTYSELPLATGEGVPSRLRARGVYVITGGLGEIGLHIAKYLAATVQARVVLTGRSALPPRDRWDDYLAGHAAGDLTRQRIERIRDIEAAGGEVLTLAADASDAAATRAAFEQAEQRFGPLNGVIHAAGLIMGDAFRPISETDADICRRQFQPKVAGLCALDEALDGRSLDFCLLVSSLSSILGGLRYGAYAAANSFMDAFAWRRSRTSQYPWLCVNWDAWLRTDEEAQLRATQAPIAGFVMSGAEGVDALARLLSVDAGVQVIVSTGDLSARVEQWVSLESIVKDADAPKTARHPRPTLQTEYVAPRTDLEKAIAEVWQDLLGVDAVGVNDNFFELGGDSFLGIQLISKLKTQLGVKISAVTLYEGPRVSLLAEIVGASAASQPAAVDHSRLRGEKRRERKLRQEQGGDTVPAGVGSELGA